MFVFFVNMKNEVIKDVDLINLPEQLVWFSGLDVSKAVFGCGIWWDSFDFGFDISLVTSAEGGFSSVFEFSEANFVANSMISVAFAGAKASNTNIFPA